MQRSDTFDRGPLDRVAAFGQHGPGGVVGVEPVRLPGPPPVEPGRAVHIDDIDPGRLQGTGEPGTVARGTLHPDPDHRASGGEERGSGPVAVGGGRELPVRYRLAGQGDDRDVDGVGVRVNPADNLQGSCHDGTSLSAGNGGEAPTAQADRTLMRLYPSSY